MRLRLFHAADGTRIAYRETGSGPPLVLVHSAGFSHREFEPLVAHLDHRFRLILPDLPLHGDSEDRPRHPYTHDWLAAVLAEFCVDVAGRRPIVGGHGLGAELLLLAASRGLLTPQRLILMPNRLHSTSSAGAPWLTAARVASLPVAGRALSHAAKLARRPDAAVKLTATGNPAAADLVRHAMADVPGNTNLARSWALFARAAREHSGRDLLDGYRSISCPVLLLWADSDDRHPERLAEEALDLLPDAVLRVLDRAGYLIAYDDAVGVAREIISFC
ncbi:MAG TPA: alpha/beta hydrolase [Baekduia sp.]|nr:alpha/beta hydrolase [Baekduia sp.]